LIVFLIEFISLSKAAFKTLGTFSNLEELGSFINPIAQVIA
jgi:hypothetical protein